MYKYPYIFYITEKSIIDTLYDLGTGYNHIEISMTLKALLYSNMENLEPKEIPYETFLFLKDTGLIDDTYNYLSPDGKHYFEVAFILKDVSQAQTLIKDKLLANPVVNLIGQVFYGRGKITKEQLCNLLNYHEVADLQLTSKDINSLLTLLNKFSILTYDKKNGLFYLKEPTQSTYNVEQFYINPSTPFSNVYNIRKAIRSCRGSIYWIDKHFRKEGLEMIIDGLAYEGVNQVNIISSSENVTQSAKSDFERIKEELESHSIIINWRIINDTSFKWHDRWIVADNICYNVPPVLAIIRGQRSDIIKESLNFDITEFINISVLL